MLFVLAATIACSDDKKNSLIEIGGDKEVIFEREEGKVSVYFKTDSRDVTVSMDEPEKTWCTAVILERRVIVSVIYNGDENDRVATLNLTSGQNTATITVTQRGAGSITLDDKLKISGGTASSAETENDKTGFENSFDRDFNTFWHTKWSDKAPYEVVYNLENANQLDYIMYHPRIPNGGNGNFSEVEIYVSTEETPAFTKIMTHDFKKSGNPAKVVLPNPVSKPKSVKFIILSGTNGNASCSEMEFYSVRQGTLKTTAIPFGGNAYVTTEGEAGGGSVSDVGLVSWGSSATVFSIYFKVNKSGDLRLYLRYRADSDGNVIQATCQGNKFDVTLPQPKINSDTIVFLGVIRKVEQGYVRVDLQGVTLKGTTFATATNLLIAGSSTGDINYVKENSSYHFGRRGPSVHMTYTVPSGNTAEWFYNEVTVPVGSDIIGSYYMANGFSQGYFGMQINSATERRILFSVWSPYETDDPSTIPKEDRVKLIRKGEGVLINDFGNEGSGGQSYLKYNWITGNTYKYLNRVRPIENGYSEYTAYFYAPELGKWRLIAQWMRPKIQTYYTGMYSFLENFSPTQGAITRKAFYRNQWIYTKDGKWIELTEGKFTTDATGNSGYRIDFKGGLDGKGFFLENCGFFNDNVATGTVFTRSATGDRPTINWSELE